LVDHWRIILPVVKKHQTCAIPVVAKKIHSAGNPRQISANPLFAKLFYRLAPALLKTGRGQL